MRRIELTIDSTLDGHTVEMVARRVMRLSRHTLTRAKYLEDGIMLDGVRVRSNVRMRAGQLLSIAIGDGESACADGRVEPMPGPLDVAYEDDDLIVLSKPAGIVMYPYDGIGEATLGNYLMHYLSQGTASPSCKLHPVHRLDRGTSGLVVFAKNAHAQHILQKALHTAAFVREYFAICHGWPTPAHGCIDAPIARAGYRPATFCVRDDGKPARTHYMVEASNAMEFVNETARDEAGRIGKCVAWGGASSATARNRAVHESACHKASAAGTQQGNVQPATLLRVRLETGRTHQIRVHMASIGCPLVGDGLYGGQIGAIARPALHSMHLSLAHPITNQRIELRSVLPDDMLSVVSRECISPFECTASDTVNDTANDAANDVANAQID